MVFASTLADAQTDRLGAREADEAGQRVIDQGIADLAARAGHEVDHAGGQTSLFQDLDQLGGDHRGALAGLEDHGVAHDQRSDHEVGSDRQGEVPGRNGDTSAERQIAVIEVFALVEGRGMIATLKLEGLAGVEFTEVDRFGHIGIGLSPSLVSLIDHPSGQLELAAAHNGGGAQQHASARIDRNALPLVEGLVAHFA
jgi:hypothetical protein